MLDRLKGKRNNKRGEKRQSDIEDWYVKGLWFGASELIWKFFKTSMFNKKVLEINCLEILKDTLSIIHRHLC